MMIEIITKETDHPLDALLTLTNMVPGTDWWHGGEGVFRTHHQESDLDLADSDENLTILLGQIYHRMYQKKCENIN